MKTLGRVLLAILGILLVVVGAVIGVENDARVAFQLFGRQLGELPLGLWMLVAFAAGALLALAGTQVSVTALRRRIRGLNRQLVLARQKQD